MFQLTLYYAGLNRGRPAAEKMGICTMDPQQQAIALLREKWGRGPRGISLTGYCPVVSAPALAIRIQNAKTFVK